MRPTCHFWWTMSVAPAADSREETHYEGDHLAQLSTDPSICAAKSGGRHVAATMATFNVAMTAANPMTRPADAAGSSSYPKFQESVAVPSDPKDSDAPNRLWIEASSTATPRPPKNSLSPLRKRSWVSVFVKSSKAASATPPTPMSSVSPTQRSMAQLDRPFRHVRRLAPIPTIGGYATVRPWGRVARWRRRDASLDPLERRRTLARQSVLWGHRSLAFSTSSIALRGERDKPQFDVRHPINESGRVRLPRRIAFRGGGPPSRRAPRAPGTGRQRREGSNFHGTTLDRGGRCSSCPSLAFSLALGVFAVAKDRGWLSPLGIESESHDSQVIQAIKRTQEVSLLSLGIQGITQEERSAKIFGKSVPGTEEKVFLQYNFDAKLGIDGAKVRVTRTGPSTYLISVPEFSFIGYAKPTFKVAAEDGGVLSWVTADIDKVEMVNQGPQR